MSRDERERELQELTVDDLHALARELDVSGRASMLKDDLVSAIAEAEETKKAAGEGDSPDGLDAMSLAEGDAVEPLAQTTPRSRRSNKAVWGVVGVLVIAAIAVLAVIWATNDDSSSASSDVGATKGTADTSYTLRSARTEGAIGEIEPEKGVFVVATLAVSDDNPAQGLLSGPAVRLRGGDGVVYAPSSEASGALGDSALASKTLGPDSPIEGDVAFDVPSEAVDGAALIGRDLSGGGGEVTFDLGLSAPAQ